MSLSFDVDTAPPAELGTAVTIRLNAGGFDRPIDTVAIVVHTEKADEKLVLGLQFVDWLGLAAAVPKSYASLFNLRADPRLDVSPNTPLAMTIRGFNGTFDLRGMVHDFSRSGLSFSTELLSQCILNRVEEAIVSFQPPGIDRRFAFGCRIRYRCLCGESLRYGVWFDPGSSQSFYVQQAALGAYVEKRLEAAMKLVFTP